MKLTIRKLKQSGYGDVLEIQWDLLKKRQNGEINDTLLIVEHSPLITIGRRGSESDILVSTSHPFWAYGYNDVAVVHNGQLTNYWRLRRWLETRGWRFTTINDTEMVAVYIADRLDNGYSLRETLDQSIKDFDGTYSFAVSTKDEIGYAKDMLGAKPLVVADTEQYVALASEEVAIQRITHDPNLITYEPYPLKVQTW